MPHEFQGVWSVAKFVAGFAAPLAGEGGVIAYLLQGPELDFIAVLRRTLGEPLTNPTAVHLFVGLIG